MALCTTYKFNDTKLYKYLDGYIEKKELEEKLTLVSDRISQWHEQFFGDTFSPSRSVRQSEFSPEKERMALDGGVASLTLTPTDIKPNKTLTLNYAVMRFIIKRNVF